MNKKDQELQERINELERKKQELCEIEIVELIELKQALRNRREAREEVLDELKKRFDSYGDILSKSNLFREIEFVKEKKA